MIVGVPYRPPGIDINDFIEEFGKICSKVRTERKLRDITGDYELNLLKTKTMCPQKFWTKCIGPRLRQELLAVL